jgi:hypothetical protein
MNTLTRFGIRRILTGWVIFGSGLVFILWLHTFRDAAPHNMIFPLLLLLWVVLAVAIWDGCKAVTPQLRFVLLLLQVAVALCASALLFQHLIRTSL